MKPKRAKAAEKSTSAERAISHKKPMERERAEPTPTDRIILRMLVRSRREFQEQRKRIDNRLGFRADNTRQNIISERIFEASDAMLLERVSKAARDQEAAIQKDLLTILERFPIWTEWLSKVKGVGPIAGATIIAEIDINIATTVSKIWQYAGLNPGMVRAKKRVEGKNGAYKLVPTDKLIRGDKLTAGYVSPFNKNLRVALCGVLADGFIKCQNAYAIEHYYTTKARLEQSQQIVTEITKGGKAKKIPWSKATKAHRDRAARRKMVKAFLQDLYVAWRELEGLPVREPYAAEYLGRKHRAA
jgi:hypothetical protein